MSDLEQEIEKLKKENKKLSLESKLRKSMAVELDRQKDLLRQATEEVEAQKEKIEGNLTKVVKVPACTVVRADLQWFLGYP